MMTTATTLITRRKKSKKKLKADLQCEHGQLGLAHKTPRAAVPDQAGSRTVNRSYVSTDRLSPAFCSPCHGVSSPPASRLILVRSSRMNISVNAN